ncbi:phosphoglycolate phosphatase [Salinicola rhizosphaerae]|uniref:Phosphoglycolate phosphatase n=1 Tax=Salinicola rhizosphaerae TaxID=1443141 RepID=A0ABQ3DSC4_9GAMM|nr:phosphoglycolate phosphatase [Salinicola rhizosphaerae]GHB07469.1 phosphoglycolate phosphatase 1 [Salinicola rhizosphaerae]
MHPMLEDIQLVAFDLDGTLIDSVPDLAAAVDAMLSERGLPAAGEARVRDWVGNGSHKLVERALQWACLREPAEAETDAALARFMDFYGQDPCARTRVYPGVVKALERLHERGIIVTLITNKPAAFIDPLLRGLSLASFFQLALGGDSLPEKKPHPAPLLHMAEHFGVAPANALMVGDSRHDVEAGKRAGFRTLAVPYGYNHGEPVAESGPDGIVESLEELV